MLTFYEEHLNGGIKVDRDNTFYVGDAAGRLWSNELLKANCERVLALLQAADYSDKKYMRKKKNGQLEESDAATIIAKLKPSDLRNKFQRDFSDCDHKFALNNGIKFYTPEDYFCSKQFAYRTIMARRTPSYEINHRFRAEEGRLRAHCP